MQNKPLAGLNILVTRPREQSLSLSQGIAAAGGVALVFPLLETVPLEDSSALDAQLARLGQYQLAIFISPAAIRHGMSAVARAGGLPAGLRVAAVGQGGARALRAQGVSTVIAPQERFDSEALLALPELQAVKGWRILIFRGEEGRELLGDTLAMRGAAVEYAACYRRLKPDLDMAALLNARPDALTLTSREALAHLWAQAGSEARSKLTSLPLFAPHERIAQAARELGWQEAIATAGGEDGLLAGLLEWGRHRGN